MVMIVNKDLAMKILHNSNFTLKFNRVSEKSENLGMYRDNFRPYTYSIGGNFC